MLTLKDWEHIVSKVKFRDYHIEIVFDIVGPQLFVYCRYMDRDKSKKYYDQIEERNKTPWVGPDTRLTPYLMPPIKEAKVGFNFPLPKTDDVDFAIRFILKCVISQEIHEIEEDFYYKGERIFDPHKK